MKRFEAVDLLLAGVAGFVAALLLCVWVGPTTHPEKVTIVVQGFVRCKGIDDGPEIARKSAAIHTLGGGDLYLQGSCLIPQETQIPKDVVLQVQPDENSSLGK
jgi:hypothetical protein